MHGLKKQGWNFLHKQPSALYPPSICKYIIRWAMCFVAIFCSLLPDNLQFHIPNLNLGEKRRKEMILCLDRMGNRYVPLQSGI